MTEPVLKSPMLSIQDVANILMRMARGESPDYKLVLMDLPFVPIGSHVSAPNISSATTLTAPAGVTKLLAQTLTQSVRYTLDGSAPTASAGFQLRANDPPLIIPVSESTVIKVIQESATADFEYQWGR